MTKATAKEREKKNMTKERKNKNECAFHLRRAPNTESTESADSEFVQRYYFYIEKRMN